MISGAGNWLAQGQAALVTAVLAQAAAALQPAARLPNLKLLRVMAEKRATFACSPGLLRPPARLAPGLLAAGDYVQGPYPATLEGAVRSGEDAVRFALEAG